MWQVDGVVEGDGGGEGGEGYQIEVGQRRSHCALGAALIRMLQSHTKRRGVVRTSTSAAANDRRESTESWLAMKTEEAEAGPP